MKALISAFLLLISITCSALPTSPSVTVGTLPDPSTLDASQFNKYDGSVYIRTSTGTADGDDAITVNNNRIAKITEIQN